MNAKINVKQGGSQSVFDALCDAVKVAQTMQCDVVLELWGGKQVYVKPDSNLNELATINSMEDELDASLIQLYKLAIKVSDTTALAFVEERAPMGTKKGNFIRGVQPEETHAERTEKLLVRIREVLAATVAAGAVSQAMTTEMQNCIGAINDRKAVDKMEDIKTEVEENPKSYALLWLLYHSVAEAQIFDVHFASDAMAQDKIKGVLADAHKFLAETPAPPSVPVDPNHPRTKRLKGYTMVQTNDIREIVSLAVPVRESLEVKNNDGDWDVLDHKVHEALKSITGIANGMLGIQAG